MGGSANQELQGPDLKDGVAFGDLEESKPLIGHVDGQQIILVRQGDDVLAVSASCKHYGGPLNEGFVADGIVRCPWHHARYELKTGRNVGAPGLESLSCYTVARDGDSVRVTGRKDPVAPPAARTHPESVVIIGAGAAGEACAETLRREGYEGPITILSQSEPFTVDRPNLSKDYLAGEAPDEWLPIRDQPFFEEQDIDYVEDEVREVNLSKKELKLSNRTLPFDALVFATGAEPRKLSTPGFDQEHVRTLRSLDDARRLVELVKKEEIKNAVVIGAGFIGLEAAASLTKQGLSVHVVAPEEIPLARIMGEEVGRHVHKIHVNHGVSFSLGRKVTSIQQQSVTLDDGTILAADLVVVGVGVSPRVSLAEDLDGVEIDDGIVVDDRLRAKNDGVWAIGDVASYPYRGSQVRVEHWTVARRHGQHAALDILGRGRPFDDVPFFWSTHWGKRLSYMGHATSTDHVTVHGSLEDHDAIVVYRNDEGKIEAVVTLGRDLLSLKAEHLLERDDQEQLEALIQH